MGQMQDIHADFNSFMVTLAKEHPDKARAFRELFTVAERDGALSHKVKELISLSLAVAAHCDSCIAVHVAKCLAAESTHDEIMESAFVAVLMGGGPAMVYTKMVYDALQEYSE